MGIAAVSYIGYMEDYVKAAMNDLKNISTLCDADASHGKIETIFRAYTPIGIVARTYEERIRDYELHPKR